MIPNQDTYTGTRIRKTRRGLRRHTWIVEGTTSWEVAARRRRRRRRRRVSARKGLVWFEECLFILQLAETLSIPYALAQQGPLAIGPASPRRPHRQEPSPGPLAQAHASNPSRQLVRSTPSPFLLSSLFSLTFPKPWRLRADGGDLGLRVAAPGVQGGHSSTERSA